MIDHHDFNHQVRQAAGITVALVACVIFGIVVLAGGDWLPGGIIVGASTTGLVREASVIRSICSTGRADASRGRKVVK